MFLFLIFFGDFGILVSVFDIFDNVLGIFDSGLDIFDSVLGILDSEELFIFDVGFRM